MTLGTVGRKNSWE